MGLLPADRIHVVYSAAIACGLAPQLDALLAGLPAAYTATLPHSGPPAARLLQTLHMMNDIRALADGTVPLEAWLRSAVALTAARQESDVFWDTLREIGRASAALANPSTVAVLPSGTATPKAPTVTTAASELGRLIRIFISYSRADEAHRKRLEVHLAPLRREGLIAPWHDQMISPGIERVREIDQKLTAADVVLLLVSADFVASDYCFHKELALAFDRHERGEARVVPIYVEPTDSVMMPFAKLQGLPRDAKPVSLWENRNEAWLDVAKGVRAVVASLGAGRSSPHTSEAREAAQDAASVPGATVAGGAVREEGRALHDAVAGMSFLWIPPGRFWMGSSRTRGAKSFDPAALDGDLPVRETAITEGFWIAETPVTNRQYALFLQQTGQQQPMYWRDPRFNDAAQPLVGVSFDEAVAFCAWLRQLSALDEQWTFDLPSEAQWEYAARGSDGRRYPWGDERPTTAHADFAQRWDVGKPAPSGGRLLGRSATGALDMAGSVWEWCLDLWSEGHAGERAESPSLGQLSATSGAPRVARGGSWCDSSEYLRCAARVRVDSSSRSPNLGFRVIGRSSRR